MSVKVQCEYCQKWVDYDEASDAPAPHQCEGNILIDEDDLTLPPVQLND
jgi:hypothetical protein